MTDARASLMQSPSPSASRLRAAWGASLSSLGQPRWRMAVCCLTALVASLTAFANIAEDYLTNDPLVRWDVQFARWLHERADPGLLDAFRYLTWAGNGVVLAVVSVGAAVLLWRRRRPNEGVLMLAAFGGAEVLNLILKLSFQRPRPELAFAHLDTYSFPSGHAMVATAVFGALAFLWSRRLRTSVPRLLVVIGCAALLAMIGFSRLYLGVHYLSDVLAGFAAGFAWLSVCLLAFGLYGDRDLRGDVRRLRRAVRERVRLSA